MEERFKIPGRVSAGLKFLMLLAIAVYIILLLFSPIDSHGFDYSFATTYPLVTSALFGVIIWANSRGGIEWDSQFIYEVTFFGSFITRYTKIYAIDEIISVYGLILHSGAVNKRRWVPFDTIVFDIVGQIKSLRVQPDFFDQAVLKSLLSIIYERKKAQFSKEVLEYMH